MRLKAADNKIIILREQAKEKTDSGLYIPDCASELPLKGKVVSAGAIFVDKERYAACVSVGDTVIFKKYGGTDVLLDGEEYLIVDHDDILAVVEE